MDIMKLLNDIDVAGKTVFLRADLNVPLDDSGNITDDHRIKAALPTIDLIREKGGKLVVASHLGRPKGKVVKELSLEPVAKRLHELSGTEVRMAPDCVGDETKSFIKDTPKDSITLLENVRFHEGETKNHDDFAKSLATDIDVFINDAFGTAHRAHASTTGITKYVEESAAGLTLKKELEFFAKCFQNPERPLIAVFGGSKVSTKLRAIENVAKAADKILIGGAMANTFFASRGLNVGKSLTEHDLLDTARDIEKKVQASGCKILLPVDLVLAKEFSKDTEFRVSTPDDIQPDEMALDIGPETVKNYRDIILNAGTNVWNGPMGVLEIEQFAQGSYGIVDAMSDAKGLTVVGGGDTDVALQNKQAFEKMSYVSTGGGAFLTLLEGKTLPAVAALG